MLTRPATLRGYTAMVLIALWILPSLVAVGHLQDHAHRYCPEHQAFEEAARGSGEGFSRLAAEVALAALPSPTGDSPGLPSHEACPVLTASTREELLATEAPPVIAACLAGSLPATAPPRSCSSLSILATAPKLSPPARA